MVTDTPDFSWVRLLLAFTTVIGLMALLAFVLKYISTRGFALPSKGMRVRRIQVVESLTVDTRRRFVIVRCDDREHFLLLNNEGDIVIDTNLRRSTQAALAETPLRAS